MYEQLDIFSFLGRSECLQKEYCWDEDINEIHDAIIRLAKKYNLSISEDEFSIWTHVPQYGYRLWLCVEVTRDIIQNIDFQNQIQDIVEDSKERKVELSCMVGACYFFTGENTASLPFSTTFMDSERRKRR